MTTILHQLRAVYGFRSPEMSTAIRILKHIRSQKPSQLGHLTFNALRAIGLPGEDVVLMRVLAILSGPSFNVLGQKFEFLDEEDDEYIDLDPEDVAAALKTGVFYHPNTGQAMPDFQRHIFVYYQAGEGISDWCYRGGK